MKWYNEIMNKKAIMLSIYTLTSIGLVLLCLFTPCFTLLWKIIFTVVIASVLLALFLGELKFPKIYKASVLCLILEIIALAIYLALYYSGLLVHFESIESLRAWFESLGIWAKLVFFLIQIAQVILIPIPAEIITVAGVLCFGALTSFLISGAAIITGSFIAFAIGRSLGVTVLYKISSKETVDKYRKLLNKKGRILLPIMFLFPLFPDDLLCFIAGTTTMSWPYFIVTTITTRLVGLGCMCFFGSGDIIPFSGWGIPVWIVLIILLVGVALVLLKNQDKVEKFIIDLFTGNRSKNKKEKMELQSSTQMENSTDYVMFSKNGENEQSVKKDNTNEQNDNSEQTESKPPKIECDALNESDKSSKNKTIKAKKTKKAKTR
jgi:uncharacterized membrane protein YdjX (TVP38/TMEM64 family)